MTSLQKKVVGVQWGMVAKRTNTVLIFIRTWKMFPTICITNTFLHTVLTHKREMIQHIWFSHVPVQYSITRTPFGMSVDTANDLCSLQEDKTVVPKIWLQIIIYHISLIISTTLSTLSTPSYASGVMKKGEQHFSKPLHLCETVS